MNQVERRRLNQLKYEKSLLEADAREVERDITKIQAKQQLRKIAPMRFGEMLDYIRNLNVELIVEMSEECFRKADKAMNDFDAHNNQGCKYMRYKATLHYDLMGRLIAEHGASDKL